MPNSNEPEKIFLKKCPILDTRNLITFLEIIQRQNSVSCVFPKTVSPVTRDDGLGSSNLLHWTSVEIVISQNQFIDGTELASLKIESETTIPQSVS